MPIVALAEVFRLRGRVLIVITLLSAFLLFWPAGWAGQRLGLVELRQQPFLWVFGAVLVGFAGLSITRLMDWVETRRAARRQFDNILLELRSRTSDERRLLTSAMEARSSTVEVAWIDREHAEVLVSKGLLQQVVEPRSAPTGSRPGKYTVPTTVWALMRGKEAHSFFEEIEENRGAFLRELMVGTFWGPRIELNFTSDAVQLMFQKLLTVKGEASQKEPQGKGPGKNPGAPGS